MALAVAWDGADTAEDYGTESAWDRFSFGDDEVPGVVRVSGVAARKLDVKSAPGVSGGTITDMGAEPVRFDVLVTMWTTEHLNQWSIVAAHIAPGAKPRAFDVQHPALIMASVTSAYVERVGLLQPGAIAGTFEVRVSCIEWFPSPKRTGTVTQKKSDAKLTDVDRVRPGPSTSGAADP